MNRRRELHDLTGFQRDLLLVVAALEDDADDLYGLAIKREMEARYGEEVNHGRLYPNLDTLVDAGYVEKNALDRRTNEYRVTPAGASLLDTLHEELQAARDGLQSRVAADGGFPDGDPCPSCGEEMDVGAVGLPGESITWQECEDCGLGWGPFTGYVETDEEGETA